MKAMIVGCGGNLGTELVRAFARAKWQFTMYDRRMLDVTNRYAVRHAVSVDRPQVVLNASAWNDVDGAEDAEVRGKVFAVNALAPMLLAEAARDAGASLVHFSTDYVFDGEKEGGCVEDDSPHPLSVYGESKREGELCALAVGNAYVCRTSRLFGRSGGSANAKPGFIDVMYRLAAARPEVVAVDEEYGMPTWTRDVAEAAVSLVSGAYAPGIYHLVNEGPAVTWYGFAREFFPVFGLTTPCRPVPAAAFPRPARRPAAAVLRNTRFPPLRPRIDALRAFRKTMTREDCP